MTRWTVVLALALSSPAVAETVPARPSAPGEIALAEGEALVKAGKPAEAVAALDLAIDQFEHANADEKRTIYCGMTMPQTLLYMGLAATAKTDAVAIAPGWCEALFLKGYALIDRGNVTDGIVFVQRAVAKAPNHAHYLNELGYAYQALKDWPKSLAAYQSAEASASLAAEGDEKRQRGRALRGIGYAYVEMGRLREAEKAYRACLTIDPNDEMAKGELDYISQLKRPKG